MDPLTALGLAANIVQFVDFTSKLLSEAHERYKSGSTVEHNDINLLTSDLETLAEDIRSGATSSSINAVKVLPANEKALRDLAHRCSEVASELLSALGALGVSSGPRIWASLCEALRSSWGKDNIERLLRKLAAFQSELQLRLLVDLRKDASLQALRGHARFDSLDDTLRKIAASILDGNARFADTLSEISTRLDLLMFEQGGTAAQMKKIHDEDVDHHLEVMAAIKSLRIPQRRVGTMEADRRVHTARVPVADELVTKIQYTVLAGLNFRGMHLRADDVAKAHNSTFQWALDDSSDSYQSWSNLIQWFRHGSGCYWINGKAGSGKSVLMKFLVNKSEITDALNIWAGSNKLLVASFFFWRLGSEFQKSRTGLLRSVLHSVLKRRPDIISQVIPDYYNETAEYFRRSEAGEKPTQVQSLSETEIKIAFLEMLLKLPSDCRLCLFIDGLDEYAGDYTELAALLKTVTSEKVKIVVSSRPIRPCTVAFESCPSLRLQDITKQDITAYIDVQVANHQHIRNLRTRDAESADKLVQEIVRRADGVFLWVILVVKQLLRGLEAFDEVDDLVQKLNAYPPELSNLYKHMMEMMDPEYRVQASKFLQIALLGAEVQGSLSLLQMSFTDEKDAGYILKLKPHDLTETEENYRSEVTEARVITRCCGLLETHGKSPRDPVTFLHRSVAEFLELDEIWNYVTGLTKSRGHNTAACLRNSCLGLLKSPSNMGSTSSKHIRRVFRHFVTYCRHVEMGKGVVANDFLDDFAQSMADETEIFKAFGSVGIFLASGMGLESDVNGKRESKHSITTRSLGALFGKFPISVAIAVLHFLPVHLQNGITSHAAKHPDSDMCSDLILLAISPYLFRFAVTEDCISDFGAIIECIMRNGADPNRARPRLPNEYLRSVSFAWLVNGLSPWRYLISEVYNFQVVNTEVMSPYMRNEALAYSTICEVVVRNGADCNAVVTAGTQALSALAVIESYRIWLDGHLRNTNDDAATELCGVIDCILSRVIELLKEGGAKRRRWHGNVLVEGPPTKRSLAEILATTEMTKEAEKDMQKEAEKDMQTKASSRLRAPDPLIKKGLLRQFRDWRHSRSKSRETRA